MGTIPSRRRPVTPSVRDRGSVLSEDPLWYKDAVIYELHVRGFYDSDGDGVGDFRGLTQKLGYLQDLGVTALWLLPFYPSPLRDDGYDIADYTGVHPSYGTLRDFEAFLHEAHRRGLRVITELVLNHTSDQHPWFQRARRAAPGSPRRDFYVWSDTPEKYRDARVIFKDFEASNWTWDPVARAYYWHRFYAHQPDLNFDHPRVRDAMLRVVDFWMDLGVDGLRLDAVPYLYEREGTTCENLPETHAFLKHLRRHIDERFKDRMVLAEANQWPEDAVAYFGEGDECHMAFHFPLMPRLFMAMRMEDRFPIIDMLEQTPPIPETCQWALFLRNHDELTLEMVTDEERDYMYRIYATDPQARINLGIRRRLAPLLGNSHRRIELMNGLLCSLPGTPVIYYGDEIGMGDNVHLGDRNGVRTPMQWSPDRNAGFSRCNPQQLYLPVIVDPEYHYEAVNVEALQNNPYSRLWWMRRLIALRRQYKAFGRGTLEVLFPDNRKVLAYIRRYGDERILVVANLSRFVEYVELPLQDLRGWVPVELFGRNAFPPIGEMPYPLTLGPHSFFWFVLQPERPATGVPARRSPGVSELAPAGPWTTLLAPPDRNALEATLPAYLGTRRWFGGRNRQIKASRIADVVPGPDPLSAHLLLIRVEYTDGEPETYLLPVAHAAGPDADRVRREAPDAVIARVAPRDGSPPGILHDALADHRFAIAMVEAMARRRRMKGVLGEVAASPTRVLPRLRPQDDPVPAPTLLSGELHNTLVQFGDRLILKVFRRLDAGINPELEIGRFLMGKRFAYIPPLAGALEYRAGRAEPSTLALLQGFVPNDGDGWRHALHFLSGYFEHALARHGEAGTVPAPQAGLLDLADLEPPHLALEMMAPSLETVRLLGQRTAELHAALASDPGDPAFAPEPFSVLYQRSVYQSQRSLTRRVFQQVRDRLRDLPDGVRHEAHAVLDLEPEVVRRFKALLERRIAAVRIRCHGDYHLGQVLWTGKDFVIIDFEGGPTRPIGERRIKRSPLVDVAGMLRSFHQAAYAALFNLEASGLHAPEALASLERWARFWYLWAGSRFLRAYLKTARTGRFLPRTRHELEILLEVFLLEKAVFELGDALNHRPQWLRIPCQGILQLTAARPGG
ncbi:MAG: maltose alpha-D-glucosyltransferase [Armatimonadota bacterium]|nr:maltose alpha-D-glucosyltransferase [Armatimonadota bacterium]